MDLISLDTETVYQKGVYSVVDLGNWRYCNDERFDCYLVSAAKEGCGPIVCRPAEFPWAEIDGADIVGANFGFDQAVITRMIELGKIPPVKFGKIYDVLDLSRFLGYPGNLAAASKYLRGKEMDKGVRDRANGLRWEDMTPDFQAEMIRYAAADVVAPLEIWKAHGHLWPAEEQELARLNRERCARGIPINVANLQTGIESLNYQLATIRGRIPWLQDQ